MLINKKLPLLFTLLAEANLIVLVATLPTPAIVLDTIRLEEAMVRPVFVVGGNTITLFVFVTIIVVVLLATCPPSLLFLTIAFVVEIPRQ